MLYATLRVLRAHGLRQQSLIDVYRATVHGKLLYMLHRLGLDSALRVIK